MKANDWKEVFCELPEINTLCLVCKGAHTPQVLFWDGEGWSNETHYYRKSYFTYWMPIVMPYERTKEA